MNHIKVASRIADYLHQGGQLDSHSAQAFFDLLCDALAEKPMTTTLLEYNIHAYDVTRLYTEGNLYSDGEGI